MKQVKHHSGFIYYTKYKSYWAKLNTNETKKTSWTFYSLKWPPLVAFTASWHSFHQRLEVDWKIVLLSFPARVARSELHLWVVYLRLFDQVYPTPV